MPSSEDLETYLADLQQSDVCADNFCSKNYPSKLVVARDEEMVAKASSLGNNIATR